MRKTIFLNEITVVDHAVIDEKGQIHGGSFLPSFLVTGEVDPNEGVVIDFSSIKKQLKALIDDQGIQKGFDHKLWILDGVSKVDQVPDFKNDRIQLKTPSVELDLPLDAIKNFKASGYANRYIGRSFEAYLEHELGNKYPGIQVTCENSTRCQTMNGQRSCLGMFRYVHGLKNSTSFGCQNNSHGHLSFFQLDRPTCNSAQELELMELISKELDDTIFIMRENISKDTKKYLSIEYTTGRGLFRATYHRDRNKLVILETETTIEYLMDYVLGKWHKELKATGACGIFVSEGLSKGAYVTL
jgi:6-pyruvoyl-tetrahydropterin synthase